MVESGELDDTALGNLAYMFESSHFDLYSLWHWILSYLGGNFFLVNADRTTSRATRSDTTCGPSNNGGPALPGLPVSLP